MFSEQSIEIKRYNINEILLDLEHNLLTTSNKTEKVLNRIKFVLQHYSEFIEESVKLRVMNSMKHAPQAVEVPVEKLRHYLQPTVITKMGGQKIPISCKSDMDKIIIKKSVERPFTDFVSNLPNIYEKTSEFYKKMVLSISDKLSIEFSREIIMKNVVFMYKGSMAIRDVLKKIKPVVGLYTFFKNSDNDTSIAINPDFPDYDRLYNRINELIYQYMIDYHTTLWANLHSAFETIEHLVTEIDGLNYNVKITKDHGFERRGNELHFQKLERDLKIQSNYLEFAHFRLHRYKLPLILMRGGLVIRKIFAEVLDVCVEHRNSLVCRANWQKASRAILL